MRYLNIRGLLFIHEWSSPLTREDFVFCIRDALARIEMHGNFSGHIALELTLQLALRKQGC